MDLKVMPRSYEDHKFILCITDEVTNYLITLPIHQSRLELIGNALIEYVVSKYCVPDYIIMDQDSAFMSSLMNYLFKKLDHNDKGSGSLQPSIVTGRTWDNIIIYHLHKTLDRSRSDVAKVFAFGNSSI